MSDLLSIAAIETASGDAGWNRSAPDCKAVWTGKIEGEDDAPEHRIIHCRPVRMNGTARFDRLGVRLAKGYHKCGSHTEIDWVRAFRFLVWDGTQWRVHRDERNIPQPVDDAVLWFDLGGVEAQSALIECRQCGIDPWWPSWNLTSGAFVLEGEAPPGNPRGRENRLALEEFDLSSPPSGVLAMRGNGEVRYRTRFLEVGFVLGRPGFSYLALDDEGRERTEKNLLRSNPGIFLQGTRLHPVGYPQQAGPLVCFSARGTTRVKGNVVSYDFTLGEADQHYSLKWEVLEDRVHLSAVRRGKSPLRAWESNAWTIACHSEVSPTTVTGHITRNGEAGILTPPAFFHAPGYGSFLMRTTGRDVLLRSDSHRPWKYTTLELKLGEVPQPEGDYVLPAGEFAADIVMEARQLSAALREETPEAVKQAVRRCTLTSMPYRADTATLTNNGNSMHCPICMDTWSGLATRIGRISPAFHPIELLRDSIERWLDNGPGYASGRMLHGGPMRYAEDEYLMTGTAALLGLAEYLSAESDPAWLDRYASPILRQLERMRARDLDGDGLVESPYRLGISGQYHWSTNWYDVISFGWKDALTNALLYRALILLEKTLAVSGHPDLGAGLSEWATLLRSSYTPAFLNPVTGWLAGWRSKDDKLHDYAFLAVNGAAATSGVLHKDLARECIRRLWDEARRIGLPDYRLGLPGNLWSVPDADMVEIMHGQAMGYYANGGLTHSQSRHFVAAMYAAGLDVDADAVLLGLCESLADGTAFGGCNSGVDWRYWDGWPSGYEGLLTDQFGILSVALDRYKP